ncbi:tRNA (adenosine(37)-N6)-dimethylallyltransferase MiaA [Lacticaseibacillus brantae]|nr:tRNA (adenosine(37)-N6)-dimethylallyltransferase MiaA [Lacticaseibacillus brantae]
MNNNKPKVLMVVGPTAVGKTDLGVHLAKKFDGEVINGDAYQIYREMAIGTAKVTPAETQGVPHHLVDLVSVRDPFSVVEFKAKATAAIADITIRGKLPIIVGGTGFYLNALRLGLPLGGAAPPTPLRAKLQTELAQKGDQWLWQQLNAVDPAAAANIPPANTRRVIRALEVIATGQLFSNQPEPLVPFDTDVIGLETERALLYERINHRVLVMMQAGLEAEVRAVLREAGPDAQALKAIGYKEFLPYFAGETSLEDVVATIQKNSRHYAKRQLTYFRHQMPTHWFDLLQQPMQLNAIETQVQTWLNGGE